MDWVHLPVNEEIVELLLKHYHNKLTYSDLESLHWSIVNHPKMGGCHPLLEKVSKLAGERAAQEYRRE